MCVANLRKLQQCRKRCKSQVDLQYWVSVLYPPSLMTNLNAHQNLCTEEATVWWLIPPLHLRCWCGSPVTWVTAGCIVPIGLDQEHVWKSGVSGSCTTGERLTWHVRHSCPDRGSDPIEVTPQRRWQYRGGDPTKEVTLRRSWPYIEMTIQELIMHRGDPTKEVILKRWWPYWGGDPTKEVTWERGDLTEVTLQRWWPYRGGDPIEEVTQRWRRCYSEGVQPDHTQSLTCVWGSHWCFHTGSMKEEEPGQTGKSEKCWRFFARLQLLAVTWGLWV